MSVKLKSPGKVADKIESYKLKEILEELEKRKRDEKMTYFVPTESQEHFFRSKSKERLVLGGNRVGKSEIGAIESISYCLGYRLFLRSTDPNYVTPFKPPVQGLITTESFGISGTANLVIFEKMMNWIPKKELKGLPKKNQQGVPVLYTFKNGSQLHVLCYEQETNKFEGSRFHFWWGDENPPQDKYFSIQRGLTDFGGYYWITATPIAQPWTYDGLFLNEAVKKFQMGLESNVKKPRKWYGAEMNAGGLSEEDIQSLIRKYRAAHMDEGEIQSRMTGKYKHLEGLVLGNFDTEVHIVEPFDIPEKSSIYISIDPHPKKPWCVMFLCILPSSKMYVTKMMYVKGVVAEIVEAIMLELNNRHPQKVIIDPYAVMNDPQTGRSLLTDVREKSDKKLIPVTASKDKVRGIQAIRSALHYNEEDGIESTLYFFNTEKEGIRQLMGWVIDDEGKASKKDDDAGENLYRLMLLRPRYKEQGTRSILQKDYTKKGVLGY